MSETTFHGFPSVEAFFDSLSPVNQRVLGIRQIGHVIGNEAQSSALSVVKRLIVGTEGKLADAPKAACDAWKTANTTSWAEMLAKAVADKVTMLKTETLTLAAGGARGPRGPSAEAIAERALQIATSAYTAFVQTNASRFPKLLSMPEGPARDAAIAKAVGKVMLVKGKVYSAQAKAELLAEAGAAEPEFDDVEEEAAEALAETPAPRHNRR